MEQSLQYAVHGAMDLEAESGFLFRSERIARGYLYVIRERWQAVSSDDWQVALGGIGESLLVGVESDASNQSVYACAQVDDAVIHAAVDVRIGDRPSCRVSIAAASPDAAARWMKEIRDLIPEVDPQTTYELPVSFWNQGQFGSDRRERALEPLRWDELAGNYPGVLGASLATLVGSEPDGIGARLHLWHGPPGTGKTHAVRMLATAWREWCELHYITDPEQFFASAEYMMDVVLGPGEGWRLVVLEDAGEFLGTDAPAAVGQGFARLLNLTDGILGYGAKTMLLLTTNADLRTLHPATRRAGRPASHLTFEAFTPDEARAWLQAQGSTMDPKGRPLTLAELYALRDGTSPVQAGEMPRLGFV